VNIFKSTSGPPK